MSQRVFLGRFEAKRLLAEGGMGRVYLAREYNPDRYVVVKQMHEHLSDDPRFRERFERETWTMSRLDHPHVVKLVEASFDEPSGPCIVMEYIRGTRLDELLHKNRKLAPARAVRLLMQLCDILASAHDLNIVHRDLKPSNLMVVDPDSRDEQIKVMDFGLAKILDNGERISEITDPSIEFALGTPAYMSPEQARGENVDHRADLYSVGVISYEMLSGELPFSATTNMDMILAHATETPRSFADVGLRHWVPRALEQVVMTCLEKNPIDRPQSARELADRFESALAYPHEEPLVRTPIGKLVVGPGLIDPDALVFHIEAWMPQRVAIMKIRGFVHDLGGDVIESAPGLIRVRVEAKSSGGSNGLSLLNAARMVRSRELDMELRLQAGPAENPNRLNLTVIFHPNSRVTLNNPNWRKQCSSVFCDLRAYVMGSNQPHC